MTDLQSELAALDRSLMTYKRHARDQYGSAKSNWPREVHASIFDMKERAKDIRRQLGLRDK